MIEPLVKKNILAIVDPLLQKKVSALEIFESIDSTNTYLLSRAKKEAKSGSFCFAEEQTQGRGRRGRTWLSPPGVNIYGSLLWRFSESKFDLSGLSLAIAVMIVNALKKFGVTESLQLKWPNDIYFQNKKLAGILIESQDAKNVVIGIGINVLAAPDPDHSICLADFHSSIPVRNLLVGLLINELLEKIPLFEVSGLSSFLTEWRRLDMFFGKKIQVSLPNETLHGVMRGVDDQGRLLLENAGEVKVFSYGEISVK
jgi:BirA family biotin operon repressor/biotin-[acetyl-CoA-carboxylase] ligase